MENVILCNSVIVGQKPIRTWIEGMEEPYRSQAQHALTFQPFSDCSTFVTSLKSALLRGFVWGASEQGVKYWENIYQGLYPNQQLF